MPYTRYNFDTLINLCNKLTDSRDWCAVYDKNSPGYLLLKADRNMHPLDADLLFDQLCEKVEPKNLSSLRIGLMESSPRFQFLRIGLMESFPRFQGRLFMGRGIVSQESPLVVG